MGSERHPDLGSVDLPPVDVEQQQYDEALKEHEQRQRRLVARDSAIRWLKEHVISVAPDAGAATGQAATSYGINQPEAYLGYCDVEKPFDWGMKFRAGGKIYVVKGLYLKSAIAGKTVSVALERTEEEMEDG